MEVGVELDGPGGKNDGSVKGTQYFSCKDKHGVILRGLASHLYGHVPLQKVQHNAMTRV